MFKNIAFVCVKVYVFFFFFLLLSTPVLPPWCHNLVCQVLSFCIVSFSGEGEKVHAASGQREVQRSGEELHVEQIQFCTLQHRAKVCVIGSEIGVLFCHLQTEIVVIFDMLAQNLNIKGTLIHMSFTVLFALCMTSAIQLCHQN